MFKLFLYKVGFYGWLDKIRLRNKKAEAVNQNKVDRILWIYRLLLSLFPKYVDSINVANMLLQVVVDFCLSGDRYKDFKYFRYKVKVNEDKTIHIFPSNMFSALLLKGHYAPFNNVRHSKQFHLIGGSVTLDENTGMFIYTTTSGKAEPIDGVQFNA